jgi:hypothetical protein
MWNVKTKVTPVIIGATDTISHPLENTSAVHQESTKSRKYNKQLCWDCTHTAENANAEAPKSLILKTALYAPLTADAE